MSEQRLRTGMKLVVASHNPGKVREIGDLLKPYGMKAVSAAEMDVDEPEETGQTFVENACLKARHSAQATGLPALADDSGLQVHALGGEPGLYSARWGGSEKDFNMAMARVNDALTEKDAREPNQRTANFICALALAWPDGDCESFEGKVFGQIVWPMRGEHGFGYDPIFTPDGHDITFGEMDPVKKHGMSHRAKAFELFTAKCLKVESGV